MRRLKGPHQGHRRERRQLDLFAPTNANCAMMTPEWRVLPVETRQSLTHLLARLFLDHAGDDRAPEREATRHDD